MARKTLFVILPAAVVFLMASFIPRQVPAAETERILQFDSRIVVHPDGSMTVTENIRVNCAGQEIKRGIYRDFPTDYRDRYGNRVRVDFEVLQVLRNGKGESFHVESHGNGKRVYVGRKDVLIPHGIHQYTLVYRTNRQLGFFSDHDELYWNVTGNGWAFVIDSASATVELPQGASDTLIFRDGFTGPQGSREKSFRTSFDEAGNLVFTTTEPLLSGEGLTIVVAWPKGFVAEPTASEKTRNFLRDNSGSILGLVGVLLLFFYYLGIWVKVGKDPEEGTIVPLFYPPDGFSPAQVRFISEMGYDNQVFAAAVIDMAVKGYLKISDENGTYRLMRRNSSTSGLSPEEKKIADKLFRNGDTIELKNSNHSVIGGAVAAVKSVLKTSYEKIYFLTNTRYFVPGLVFSVLAFLGALLLDSWGRGGEGTFIGLWVLGWTMGVVFLFMRVADAWRVALSSSGGRIAAYGGAFFLTLFFLPFAGGEIMGLYLLSTTASISILVLLVSIVLLNVLFYRLLKAPTRAGRQILDKIEGFRMYLTVAEKDRLNMLNPPERTPELFEKYLPYALALGVEHEWAKQFSDVLASAGEGETGYQPVWYSGHGWSRFGSTGFASSIGSSLSGAIS
ncbi:MAG: DUF2207 domain-containing protein, partial [Deltaproteobacteria bacterium]|nr:DUF2207 domain-containing protein [Deltaproteobacteria bacterium]